MVSGDLTWKQYAGRLKIAAWGSIGSWGIGLVATPVGGIIAAIIYDQWIQPQLYEQRDLYPRSETVGPFETEPW